MLMLLLVILIAPTTISLTLIGITSYFKTHDWTTVDYVNLTLSSFVPILNLLIIYYGFPSVSNTVRNRKKVREDLEFCEEKEANEKLKNIDIKYIERYLRKKKLEKLCIKSE